MKKTFWCVEYSTWGANGTANAWFDDIDKAREFASADYSEKPVRHTYKDADKINRAEMLVAETAYEFNC